MMLVAVALCLIALAAIGPLVAIGVQLLQPTRTPSRPKYAPGGVWPPVPPKGPGGGSRTTITHDNGCSISYGKNSQFDQVIAKALKEGVIDRFTAADLIHDLPGMPVARPLHPAYGQKPTYELTPDGWEELPQYEPYRQPVVIKPEPRLVARGYEEYRPVECDHDTITIAALDGSTWHHPTCNCDQGGAR